MIGMVKKDLLITRLYAIIFFLSSFCFIGTYFVIKIIVFHSELPDTDFSRTLLSILPLILIMEFNCKNFGFDRTGKQSEKYMNALPLSSQKIVLAKFISSVIFTTYGLLISFLCMTVFTLMDNCSISLPLYKNIWIGYCSILIILFFQMPVLVYNGNELLSFLVPSVCLFLPFGISACIHNLDINAVIESISRYLAEHTILSNYLPVLMSAVTLIIGIISFYISNQIYQRREF